MHELSLVEEFLKRPHQEVTQLAAQVGRETVTIGDSTHCKFLVFMPSREFLNFLAEHSRCYPAFHLKMQAEITDLIQENGRISETAALSQIWLHSVY